MRSLGGAEDEHGESTGGKPEKCAATLGLYDPVHDHCQGSERKRPLGELAPDEQNGGSECPGAQVHAERVRLVDSRAADAFEPAGIGGLQDEDAEVEATEDVGQQKVADSFFVIDQPVDQVDQHDVFREQDGEFEMVRRAQRPQVLDPDPQRQDDQQSGARVCGPGWPIRLRGQADGGNQRDPGGDQRPPQVR